MARYGKDINSITCTGRAVGSPFLATVPNGKVSTTQAVFKIACSKGPGPDGEDRCEFFTVVCYGDKAICAEKYIDKGVRVAVSGHLISMAMKDRSGRANTSLVIAADYVTPCDKEYSPANAEMPELPEARSSMPDTPGLGSQMEMEGL